MILYQSSSKFIPDNLDSNSNSAKSYIIVSGQDILESIINGQIAVLDEDDLKFSEIIILSKHFLGYLDNTSCYAVEVSSSSSLLAGTKLTPMHSMLGKIPDNFFSLASRAVQIVEWYRANQFCGKCGQSTTEHSDERAMQCKCGNLIYPKISPCVIVLVTNGENLLLAHNKNFPGNFYSTLAGFIEPGETSEDALCREVFEEVNIEIENIKYYSSQSWPFPSQLMLGFHAEYKSGEINPDGIEIDKAEWFHYKKLPQVPPGKISISGRLIEDYLRRLNN